MSNANVIQVFWPFCIFLCFCRWHFRYSVWALFVRVYILSISKDSFKHFQRFSNALKRFLAYLPARTPPAPKKALVRRATNITSINFKDPRFTERRTFFTEICQCSLFWVTIIFFWLTLHIDQSHKNHNVRLQLSQAGCSILFPLTVLL